MAGSPQSDSFNRWTVHSGGQSILAPSVEWPQEVGAVCDPTAFDGILELPPGLLGPRNGNVIVDLVEPDCQPSSWPGVVEEMTFKDVVPWTVIRVAK